MDLLQQSAVEGGSIMGMHDVIQEHLPFTASVLAVCAHPDDESFGLGAALSTWADQGTRVSVLSFTHGEASTLGANRGNLHQLRANELATAAGELGVETVRLLKYQMVDSPKSRPTSYRQTSAVPWSSSMRVSCCIRRGRDHRALRSCAGHRDRHGSGRRDWHTGAWLGPSRGDCGTAQR